MTVEPENEKTKQKLEWAEKQRDANQPTVPSTIGDEFEINTFMRVDLPEIQVNLLTWNTFSLSLHCLPHPCAELVDVCERRALRRNFLSCQSQLHRNGSLNWLSLWIFQAKFGANSPVEALREVRKTKDNWKGWWHPWLPLVCWTSIPKWANAETLPCRWEWGLLPSNALRNVVSWGRRLSQTPC